MAKKNENQEVQRIQELEARILELEAQLQNTPKNTGSVRKQEIIKILEAGPASIKNIADTLETSSRNVSSVLTSLRKNGYVIHTDEASRKYLVSAPSNTPEKMTRGDVAPITNTAADPENSDFNDNIEEVPDAPDMPLDDDDLM